MIEFVFVVPDGRLVSVWFMEKNKTARRHAAAVCRGLELAGAEFLGEL